MNLAIIAPELTLFCGALLILMLDVFLAKKVKNFFCISHLLALIFTTISLFMVIKNFNTGESSFSNMFESTPLTAFCKALAITLLTVVILYSLNFVISAPKISAEFLALLMIATTGGMVLISATDFLVFYLGLELQALSLYLLAAINRNSPKSSEAGMKYFILGCLASGILLFGISMIYGFSGTTNFRTMMELYQSTTATLPTKVSIGVLFGFILVITAMFFKISAAPFHMWSPDVYEGAPTIVTTFFATIAKLTTVAAFIHLLCSLQIKWLGIEKIFIFTAILSLAVGSFGAIFQKNFKRLLAYSSIGHIGFILLAISTLSREGMTSALLYITIYAIISLGAFGFLLLISSANFDKESDEENERIFAISSLAGLAKTNPTMAFALATLIFSSAGIPPLAGFFSKFYVLASALSHGFLISSIAAILFSVVSAFYYLRIVKIMYFDEPQKVMSLKTITNVKVMILFAAIFNLLLIFALNPLLSSIGNFLFF